MITKNVEGQLSLDIFENFQIDYSLIKYKKTEDSNEKYSSGGFIISDNVSSIQWSSNPSNGSTDRTPVIKKLIDRLVFKYRDWRSEEPEKVFEKIFKSKSGLKSIPSRTEKYNKLLESAKESGQVALLEQLKKNEDRVRLENILFDTSFNFYITEELLIEFSQKCKKGLRLDWIKNFNRIIPSNVIEEKKKADVLRIFDNYVVLHYDPAGKSTKLTEAEIARKKDPILFGVSSKSRRLYFIGDWIDEHCNLTFADLVDQLGEDKLKL